MALFGRSSGHVCIRVLVLLTIVVAVGSSLRAQQSSAPPTAARANSYDDPWENLWIAHAHQVLGGAGKTDGFVLQIGDSITHSRAYGSWPFSPTGAVASDLATVQWARADAWGSGQGDVNNRNGWYLSGADTTGWRGMTALGGVSISEYLLGCCNGDGVAMPASTTLAEAQRVVADPTYVTNLQIDTVIAAFSDAQFAVVMLGTNDPGNPQNIGDLTSIIDKLEARHIVPILSTIPPRSGSLSDATIQFNAALVQLAQARMLPLIDFYQEVLLRRPGTTWFGTLIGTDGVHPTGDNGGYTVNSDPYVPGGDPSTQTTGDALLNVGYLLRSWLTVQKLSEVRLKVIDDNLVPSATLTSPLPGAAYTAPANISLAATASDPNGSIARVEFHANGALVGSDTTSPYQFSWNNVGSGSYDITARAVDNLGATGDSNAVTVTVNQPTTMHIGDLDGSVAATGKQNWRATFTIVVHSAAETPLAGAVVTGQWSGASAGSSTCTTNASGSCSVTTGNISIKKSPATFSVSSVSRSGYVYQSSSNHDVDGDSTGSTIAVQKP